MALRFPNPGADIERMTKSYCIINRESKRRKKQSFDLDFMVEAMIEQYQVSSSGAVGAEALRRSTRQDRSRDPLYNQLKMYSEIYRMLGLLRTGSRSLDFTTTILGDSLCEYSVTRPELAVGLLRQCFMSVTFPNPSTQNIGISRQRPIRWLLLLALELGGRITRDEMILGVLKIDDDQIQNRLKIAADEILNLRGNSRSNLSDAVARFAKQESVQVNTLQNYTRLPVGLLKSNTISWGRSYRTADIYEESMVALVLSDRGVADATWLTNARDVREENLGQFTDEVRAHFANYSFYSMLVRAGVDLGLVKGELEVSGDGCRNLLKEFGICGPFDFLYSPVLEASDSILRLATDLENR